MQRMLLKTAFFCGVVVVGGTQAQVAAIPPEGVKVLEENTSIQTSASILRYDQNHDGMVSLEEFNQVAEDNFHTMDKNSNGVLDGEDVFLRRQEQGRSIDWNNDGVLNALDTKLEQQMWKQAKARVSSAKR